MKISLIILFIFIIVLIYFGIKLIFWLIDTDRIIIEQARQIKSNVQPMHSMFTDLRAQLKECRCKDTTASDNKENWSEYLDIFLNTVSFILFFIYPVLLLAAIWSVCFCFSILRLLIFCFMERLQNWNIFISQQATHVRVKK